MARSKNTRRAATEPRRPPGTVVRADGRETKRIHPYLPVDLHRRFVTYCASNYKDQSDVTVEALLAYLDAHEDRK